jgi:cell division initiation protein
MRLTPLDLQNHRFSHRLRGYDTAEVEGFVRMVGEDYESLFRENEALHETVRGLEARVAELTGQEGRLRETLVTVQTLTEDLKRTSIREAEMKIAEAEVRAEKILDAAHRRAARLEEQVRELRLLRGRVTAAVRTTLETHAALLEGLSSETEPAAEAMPGAAPAWRPVPLPARTDPATAAPAATPA